VSPQAGPAVSVLLALLALLQPPTRLCRVVLAAVAPATVHVPVALAPSTVLAVVAPVQT
jgi:hypothetical protein